MKVLLVDDSKLSRRIQKKVLSEVGIVDVVEADHGQDALEKLDAIEFAVDLVMTDWNMPVMGGEGFIAALRSHAAGGNLPVILISSIWEEEQLQRAFTAGATSYIMKPFRRETLMRKIRSSTNVASLRRQTEAAPASEGPKATLSGDLESYGFGELIQFFNITRKTGELIIRPEVGEAGVALRQGEVCDAWIGRFASEQAFFAIARLKGGRFDFFEDVPPKRVSISTATITLLMEAMRLQDEEEARAT